MDAEQVRRRVDAARATVARAISPTLAGGAGVVSCGIGFYALYVEPAELIRYETTLWVAMVLVAGGFLLGWGAGAPE